MLAKVRRPQAAASKERFHDRSTEIGLALEFDFLAMTNANPDAVSRIVNTGQSEKGNSSTLMGFVVHQGHGKVARASFEYCTIVSSGHQFLQYPNECRALADSCLQQQPTGTDEQILGRARARSALAAGKSANHLAASFGFAISS